jgi:hypothetical protein
MNRIITYCIDHSSGIVYSRVGSDLAVPMLDWNGMTPENNFAANYNLERVSIYAVGSAWDMLKWTKKIPIKLKNRHRQFWGMKSLKEDTNEAIRV